MLTFTAVYRVNWLRAKARYTRWQEEENLVSHEMQWTINWFKHQEVTWQKRMDSLQQSGQATSGLHCYAEKQRHLWSEFAVTSSNAFRPHLPLPVV